MRLDLLVSEREGISRARAQNLIKTGGVRVEGVLTDKPSAEVDPTVDLSVSDTLKYASLGGLKLENALSIFSVDVSGMRCLDLGAANGGFTDCLLQKGAAEVCAVDLTIAFPGRLSEDPRVHIFDGVNIRDLSQVFPEDKFDFVCVDLSFISLRGFFLLFRSLLKENGILITLFKPQFEVGRKALPKSGIVRDRKASEKAFADFLAAAKAAGFRCYGDCFVPALFPDKNREKTLLFKPE